MRYEQDLEPHRDREKEAVQPKQSPKPCPTHAWAQLGYQRVNVTLRWG